MAGLEIFKYEDLSGVVQKFQFSNVWFVNQVPKRFVNGVTAQWDVVIPKIEVDKDFVKNTDASQTVTGTTRQTQHFTMPTVYKHVALNINEVANLRKLGQNVRDAKGQDIVMQEMESMARRYGAYLQEFLITQALTGSFAITVNGYSQTISYGVPAVNQINHGGAPWSTVTTKIPEHIADGVAKMVQSSGLDAKWMVANSKTLAYLTENDHTSHYFGYGGNGSLLRTGLDGATFMGLTVKPINGMYSAAGETEEFTTKLIPDNKVYLLPDFAERWIEMYVGLDNWVDGDGNVQEGWGPNAWIDLVKDPPSYLLYLRSTSFPIVRIPGAIVQLTVG